MFQVKRIAYHHCVVINVILKNRESFELACSENKHVSKISASKNREDTVAKNIKGHQNVIKDLVSKIILTLSNSQGTERTSPRANNLITTIIDVYPRL